MRILSLDYGRRRTGVAATDPEQIIANGLTTVETPKLLLWLADYLGREAVERVIIGLPLQANGQPSENEARVRAFAARFRKAFPKVPLDFYDERFTSVLAHQTMLSGGLGKMKRRDKALVDEISACILLQDYMERRQHTSHP